MSTLYRFPCRVTKVEERHTPVHTGGTGDATTFSLRSEGWFITLDIGISLGLGPDKPDLIVGDLLPLPGRSVKCPSQ